MPSFIKRFFAKKDEKTLIINNTININFNFGGGIIGDGKVEEYNNYQVEFRNGIEKQFIEYSNQVDQLIDTQDTGGMIDLLQTVRSYTTEKYTEGVESGYLPSEPMNSYELDEFKIGKQFLECAIYIQGRQIGTLYARLLRKMGNFIRKTDLETAKDIFEEIFIIKQDLRTDKKILSAIYEKLGRCRQNPALLKENKKNSV